MPNTKTLRSVIMEISLRDIVKYLICIVLIANKRCVANFVDFGSIPDEDTTIWETKSILREPRKYEGNSWIWQDYEFGSGIGNREELYITNIEVWQDFQLAENIKNRQILRHKNNIYIAGTEKASLSLYHFGVEAKYVSLYARISTNETIKAFKIISLSHTVDESLKSNIIVVLSVENSNKVYTLEWFYLLDNHFVHFWTWKMEKLVKNIEYFKADDRHKLLLLYEKDVLFSEPLSLIEIYDITINGHLSKFQLCHHFLVLDSFDIQICPSHEETTMISLLSKDHLVLYEYKDEDIVKCTFKQIQNITITGLTNAICFQSGNINYLATSGSITNLFRSNNNNFLNDEKMEEFFHEIGDITSIRYLPINTYRGDVLLLIQLRNSTSLALSWNGLNFNPISETNKKFSEFDLSRSTVIPNYGILIDNFLIKINVKLRQLFKSNENEMKNMLETKSMVQDLLDKQEQIIVESQHSFKGNNINISEIKNFSNSLDIDIHELNTKKTDDLLITFGSYKINLYEMQENYEEALSLIEKIEMESNNIEDIITHIAISNLNTRRDFHEINFLGNLEINGKLIVNNLTIDFLNNNSMKSLISECTQNKTKIFGIKMFPAIEILNNKFKLKYLNKIPLSNIQFEELNKDYSDFNLSNISKLEVIKNLNISNFRGIHWNNLTEKLVFTNFKKVIPDSTKIIGLMNVGHIRLDYLNKFQYPSNYVLKSDPEEADITKDKTFESIRVSNLQDVKTINGIDADEFIILHADQNLKHQITFENLIIDKSLEIDGSIIGLPNQDINLDLTLLNSNNVQSNTIFTNLYISGNIYVRDSINGTDWLKLNDLILEGENNSIVTGTKTFLGNVHIIDNLEIKTGVINNHFVRDFITLDSRQILPNLSSISGNVEFIKVAYEELKILEDKINSNSNEKIFTTCMDKPLIFIVPPIIDELSSLYINENLNSSEFSKKVKSLLENSCFEHLKVKKLSVKNLTAVVINDVRFDYFQTHKILKTRYQTLSGNITIENLAIEKLYTELTNSRLSSDFENIIQQISLFYNNIFNANMPINSVNVTKYIVTSKINEEDLNDIFDVNFIQQFIFRTNQTIKKIVVDGLINKINITRKANDLVLHTEDDVVLKGTKKVKKLKSNNLKVELINGHSIDEVISSEINQFLVGPVKITGFVNVEKVFQSNGKFNNIVFKDISETVNQLDEKLFKLTGEFFVTTESLINDLNVYGYVQQKSMDNFVENLIFSNERKILISGEKIFSDSLHFISEIFLRKNLNDINLENFFQNALLIDIPISLSSRIMFNNDILVEEELGIKNNLQAATIRGINIDELMENAVYLNRPTFIPETASFLNVIFKSNIVVDTWNNTKLDSLFLLGKQESIRNTLMCVDLTVNSLEIEGFVNSKNLSEIYENTLMLSTNQNIMSTLTFLNNVYMKDNFITPLINKIDMNKIISLKYADQMNGNFVFHDLIVFKNSLSVSRNVNNINLQNWQSSVVTIYSPITEILGDWVLTHKSVFEKTLHGSGLINEMNITKFRENMENQTREMQFSVLKQMNKLNIICEELQRMKSNAENMLYKFKSFEYLRVLDFDETILSVHHFEFKNIDYMMVNFESCNLDVFAYTNEGFMLAANISNFGYVKQFITLAHEDKLYFATVGKSECGRSSGNLWSLENYQFTYILDLGNVTDIQKLDNDAFAVVVNHQVQEWSIKEINENLLQPVNIIPIKDKNVQFLINENETLLASRDTIYGLRSENLEFEEYENPFNTNDILSFQAGVTRKDYLLFYDERISEDYIYLCNNDLSQRHILQTIKSHKPNSFLIMNFRGFQENLLIFSENKRKIQIYEYRGIKEFKYHSSLKMKVDKLFHIELRIHPYSAKSKCLVVIQDHKLVILKAVMFGETLSVNEPLFCDAN